MAYGYCQGHAAQLRRGKILAPLGRVRPPSPEGFSWCSKCKTHLPIAQFSPDKTRGGLDRVCKPCKAAYQREYNQRKGKEYVARKVTLGKWKITEEQYQAMFEAQNDKCAICGAEARMKKLCIDHDHKTGLIRGLLCQDCNLGMGQFADDPDIMQKAVQYLRIGGVVHNPELRMPDTWHAKRTQKRDQARARNRNEP